MTVLRDFRADGSFYERSLEGTLGKGKLQSMWQSLTEDQRKVLHLYFFNGDTLEEVAAKIGQSVGNIRNHYYRGLEKLRKKVLSSSEKTK